MPGSGPYILQTGNSAPLDPDADLKLSPLWPLQQALRTGFKTASNSASSTAAQTARVIAARGDVESLFASWRDSASLTKLRNAIQILISPPTLDLTNDSVLAGFQTQLLGVSQWNDSLPN